MNGVSFVVERGETLVLTGPSGAGKTSLLRAIAGLETLQSGEFMLAGRNVTALPPQKRRVALVFQDDALFPHLTVAANLAFGMKRADKPRLQALARALEIEEHLNKRSAQLSGGERQRASLARAVLSDPDVLLLDEPLAHLDPQLRRRIGPAFAVFAKSWGGPAIFVTHDHEEAMSFADRIAVLMEGRIEQCGAPLDIYERPASVAVARFFGSPPMNVLDGAQFLTGVRAEHVHVRADGPLRGRVTGATMTGPQTFVHAATPRGELTARLPQAHDVPAAGEEASFWFEERNTVRFDHASGQRLP